MNCRELNKDYLGNVLLYHLNPTRHFSRQIFVSSKTHSEAALIKCIRFFGFFFQLLKNCILVQSIDFQENVFFSLSSQEQRERWGKGVQEDRQINKAEFVEKALQTDSCHQRLIHH